MLKTIIDTIKLNIFHINYKISTDKKSNLYYQKVKKSISKNRIILLKNFLKGILLIINGILKGIVFIHRTKTNKLPENSILALVTTRNQYTAISNLKNKVKNLYIMDYPNQHFGEIKHPTFFSNFLSLFFTPILFLNILKANNDRRKNVFFHFYEYFITYGNYITLKKVIGKLSPKLIILLNDHSGINRVLLKVAREEGIKTIYIQHASVNTSFPPLDFDYALLDGMDAANKYSEIGNSNTTVYLTGISKFDKYKPFINSSKKINTIGICTSFDDMEEVENLSLFLLRKFNMNLIIRPHPREDVMKFHKLKEKGVQLSLASDENSFEFLKKVDLIIAGDSNIVLESALLNVYPVRFDFNKARQDQYGFIKNNIIRYFNSLEDLERFIRLIRNDKPAVRDKIKYYCETVNTEYDGLSSFLITQCLDNFITESSTNSAIWERDSSILNLTVYRLKK